MFAAPLCAGDHLPAAEPKNGALDRVPSPDDKKSGRVKFDDRGNAVWEWAESTGSFGTEASNKRLQKLHNPTLTITDDGPPPPAVSAPAKPTAVKENRKGVTQGYSPYDSGVLVKAETEARPAKKKDLRRLSEWLKLREQAKRNKQEED